MKTQRKVKFLIIGAGIGGLSAAAELHSWKEDSVLVVEREKDVPRNLANGVHYLHSDDFGTPFPFEFKEVVATEEIWDPRKDEFKKASHLPEMIDYSMKVMGLRHPSSIMDPGNRPWNTYLPMSNNMNDLIDAYVRYIPSGRFECGLSLKSIEEGKALFVETGTEHGACDELEVEFEHCICTVPLNHLTKMTHGAGERFSGIEFQQRPLYITNYTDVKDIVPNWLISLYISDSRFPVYRITVLNKVISMESLVPLSYDDQVITKYHLGRYFDYDLKNVHPYTWNTGRIWGLNKDLREAIVGWYAGQSIHLVGRFGQWDGKLTMDTTILQAKKVVKKILNIGP
jgi:hypothetical protein